MILGNDVVTNLPSLVPCTPFGCVLLARTIHASLAGPIGTALDGFGSENFFLEPRAAGMRAMLPHVDLFLPVHNLKSLVDLAKTLSAPIKETPQWK